MAVASSIQKYDVRFKVGDEAEQGFMVYRGKSGFPGDSGRTDRSAQPDSPLPGQNLPMITRDFSGGGLDSRHVLPNTYGYGYPALITPRGVCPPGVLEELEMPSGVTGDWYPRASFEGDFTTGEPYSVYLLVGHYALKALGNRPPVSIDNNFGTQRPLSSCRFNGPAFVGTDTGNLWRVSNGWTQSGSYARKYLVSLSMTFGGQFAGTSGQGGQYKNAVVGTDQTTGALSWTTVDPMSGPWYPGTPVPVGQSHAGVTGLIATAETFAVIKSDGVWKVDGRGKARWLTRYWADDWDYLHNGAVAMFYGPGFVLASHANYLDLVPFTDARQNAPMPVQPGAAFTNETPCYGQVTAMTTVAGKALVAMYNVDLNESTLWLGQLRDEAGVETLGLMVWHGAIQVVPGKVQELFLSSVAPTGEENVPWLWIGSSDDGTPRLFRTRMPRGGSDPHLDASFPYADRFTFYTGWNDGGSAYSATEKSSRRVDAVLDGENESNYVEIAIAVDNGEYSDVGTITEPRDSILVDQQDGIAFSLRINGVGSESSPTTLRNVTLNTTLRPEQMEEREFIFDITPDMLDNQGAAITQTPDELEAYLRSLQLEHDVTLFDEFGTELTGKVMPGVRSVPVLDPTTNGWRKLVRVVFHKSTEEWRWDDGGTYEPGGTW